MGSIVSLGTSQAYEPWPLLSLGSQTLTLIHISHPEAQSLPFLEKLSFCSLEYLYQPVSPGVTQSFVLLFCIPPTFFVLLLL